MVLAGNDIVKMPVFPWHSQEKVEKLLVPGYTPVKDGRCLS